MTAVNLDHDLLRSAVAQPEVLHWQTWAALAPGPSLLVLGAVHGNEVCGAHGIVRPSTTWRTGASCCGAAG